MNNVTQGRLFLTWRRTLPLPVIKGRLTPASTLMVPDLP